jgi:hypothetical protein
VTDRAWRKSGSAGFRVPPTVRTLPAGLCSKTYEDYCCTAVLEPAGATGALDLVWRGHGIVRKIVRGVVAAPLQPRSRGSFKVPPGFSSWLERVMRTLVVACGAVVALTTAPAMAADIAVKRPVYKAPPPVSAYRWTGCYVGGHVGGLWAKKDWTLAPPDPVTPLGSHEANSWLGGVQGG